VEGFDLIRHRARLCHAEARAKAGGTQTAAALLDGATGLTGVGRQAVPDDDPLLCGAEAVLDRSTPAIFYKQSVGAADAAFYQAHEFAHYWLDSATGACAVGEIDDSMPEERIPLGIQRVDGYGPRERRECQANVFAREFLLPTTEARRLFREERLPAPAIAQRLGVSLGMVQQQLALALLVPEVQIDEQSGERPSPPLDDSQRAAAEADEGPHLVEARIRSLHVIGVSF
jgi:DNA helicase-2/ATP-dependent DNA helicase PcrA